MGISREPSPILIMIDQKQLENVEYVNCEIKSRIVAANAAFNRKETIHQQIGHTFQEESNEVLQLENSFVWF